ncbi:MAG: hypothetical protein HW383_764 [Candidatus Magasanikbacteria bacterium]|nr:hypothetical protein [Candidatus Magasanikbacteria bacterium]
MSSFEPQFHEFFVEGRDAEASHVLLHITEPASDEERRRGYFFAIAEINQGTPKSVHVVQSWIEHLEITYYEGPSEGTEAHFEETLQRLNRQSVLYLRQHQEEEIHIIAGVLVGGSLIFAIHGEPMTLLFYRGKDNSLHRLDISGERGNEPAPPDQLFSNVLSGVINPNDVLFFGSPHTDDFFSDDRIQKVLETRSAGETAHHIQKVLAEIDSELSFGGVFVQAASSAAAVVIGSTAASIKERRDMADRPNRNEQSGRMTASIGRTTRSVSRLKKIPWVKIGQIIWSGLLALGRGLMIAAAAILHFFSSLFVLIVNRRDERRTVIENWKRGWRNLIEWFSVRFRSLTVMGKIIVGIIILAVLGLAGGGYASSMIKARRLAQEKFTALKTQIEKTRDEAEASLIYRDEKQARTRLTDAIALLNDLPTDTKEHRDAGAALKDGLNQLEVKLRHEIPTTPQMLSDTSALASGYVAQASPLPGFIAVSSQKDGLITAMLTPNGAVAEWSAKEKLVKNSQITFPAQNARPKTLVAYNRRLYVLDPANSQIYKHDKVTGGFSAGKIWVTDASTLADAVSLAVDGSIWVLRADGGIIKFDSGVGTPIETAGVFPALQKPIALYTNPDSGWLYLFEPEQKRIVVLTKTGDFRAQYTFPNFGAVNDVVYDEPSRLMYLLSDGKVWKAPLSHL